MDTTTFCPHCGAEVPNGAQFCPRCGKAVAVPAAIPVAPPAPAPAPAPRPVQPSSAPVPSPARSRTWWIIPVVVLALGAVVFLLLTGAPYGRDGDKAVSPRASTAETETIREGDSSSAATATLVEEPAPPAATTTTVAVPPPILREEPPPSVLGEPATTTPPPTRPREEVRPRVVVVPPPSRPRENVPPPVAVAPPPSREISGDEAVNILRGFVTSRDYYRIGTTCTSIRNAGYKNVGYTLEVHDTCRDRLLGLWRVDAKTREVFRQREDGRYLRP